MGIARTRAIALFGIEAIVVDVEGSITDGTPGLHLIGLSDTVRNEIRDRVRAAIINSDQQFPHRHIAVSLFPISLPKQGSVFDLAIAVAVLAANNVIPAQACASMALIGELGLDWQVRPVHGVLPAVLAAVEAGVSVVVVSQANAAEASLVPGIDVIGVTSLGTLIAQLRGMSPPDEGGDDPHDSYHPTAHPTIGLPGDLDLAQVRGQAGGRKAVEVAAAGGHHLALVGPAGTSAVMLAERLPGLLPDLDHDTALEVTALHSLANILPPDKPLIVRPPFRAPHHTDPRGAVLGARTSRTVHPGAVALAHRGVLFLDDAPEFSVQTLKSLARPLEDGTVTVSGAQGIVTFPARPIAVLAAHPCPCGAPDAQACTCPPGVRQRYLARLPRSLLDRVGIKVRLAPASPAELRRDLAAAESSRRVADRVQVARDRAARRLADTPWRTNAEIPGPELRRRFTPPAQATAILDAALTGGQLTPRGLDQVLRLAWTLADLSGSTAPSPEDITTALRLWDGFSEPPNS
ncbi:ATP-binding protein [Actinomadura sp. KC216]|uniref:YifB family Mg chelatase-like AAA ATPase n=1 Tax=Actinomadura sp. KC216 TaxID=2530370 RepID=UPI001042CDF7|nr:YifB family Mg chelatase-like AAA ATPase [Actinomadura sp. KC216]TDB91191.1 ATP-binding protein [Actinomadura sp. KC216]